MKEWIEEWQSGNEEDPAGFLSPMFEDFEMFYGAPVNGARFKCFWEEICWNESLYLLSFKYASPTWNNHR